MSMSDTPFVRLLDAVLVRPAALTDDDEAGGLIDDTPEIEEAPIVRLIPVGCNVYTTDEQLVWLFVDTDDDGPERAGVDSIGRCNYWHDSTIDDSGWDAVLGLQAGTWYDWLMAEGVAPGQRFLVRLRFSTSQNYFGEWDGEWDAEVVAREPWSAERSAAAWWQVVAGGMFA